VRQTALVSKPALGDEGDVEGYDGHCGQGDEDGFEAIGANIWNLLDTDMRCASAYVDIPEM
jgi:hypothetical protein